MWRSHVLPISSSPKPLQIFMMFGVWGGYAKNGLADMFLA